MQPPLLPCTPTSHPSWILAILAIRSHHPLVYTSVLSPGFTENTIPTCRSPLVDDLLSFLRLILAMHNTSSPLGRLKMPLRSLKSFRKSPASLSHLKQLENQGCGGCGGGQEASPYQEA